jgi:hypothetical protein
MTNMDPQTTADFWDAYVTAADADRLASSPHDDQLCRRAQTPWLGTPAAAHSGNVVPRRLSTGEGHDVVDLAVCRRLAFDSAPDTFRRRARC